MGHKLRHGPWFHFHYDAFGSCWGFFGTLNLGRKEPIKVPMVLGVILLCLYFGKKKISSFVDDNL